MTNYSENETLAAMAVWEWALEAFLDNNSPMHPAINKWRERNGAMAARQDSIRLGVWCENVWAAISEDVRDGFSFDWEIVPSALQTLEWKDSGDCPDMPDAKLHAKIVEAKLRAHMLENDYAKIPPVKIPGYDDSFVSLLVRAKFYEEQSDGSFYTEPTEENPANLWSVEARTPDGPAIVLTYHGTRGDADAAAKLLSAMTGLPVIDRG